MESLEEDQENVESVSPKNEKADETLFNIDDSQLSNDIPNPFDDF